MDAKIMVKLVFNTQTPFETLRAMSLGKTIVVFATTALTILGVVLIFNLEGILRVILGG